MRDPRTLRERTQDVWDRQVQNWVGSVEAYQNHTVKFVGLWLDQLLGVQKQGHKFLQEWTSVAGRQGEEWRKFWQSRGRRSSLSVTSGSGRGDA